MDKVNYKVSLVLNAIFLIIILSFVIQVRDLNDTVSVANLESEEAESELVYAEDEIVYLNTELRKANQLISDLENKLNPEPFKPALGLTEAQNKLCLAIVTFTETNGEPTLARETIAWSILNRAIDKRAKDGKNFAYKNNICAVAAASKQFSGMGPYIVDIEDVVWGNITEFTPALAKKDPLEMKAWRDIVRISNQIIDGKLTRKTTATHFISFRGMNGARRPNWIDYFMPVGTSTESGLHTLYRDYGYDRETGDIVYFTKATPYNPNLHRY